MFYEEKKKEQQVGNYFESKMSHNQESEYE